MSRTTPQARQSLTHQQRNLLLAEPIARLSIDKRVVLREDATMAEGLDMQYLALSALDFVMERSAIEAGATTAEIVEHIANEATRVKPSLTNEQARKIGQVVLDHLANARNNHLAFRAEYFDADRGALSLHDFRLLAISTADEGPPRFKLAAGAQTLMLAMLDVAPEFAEEAEAIMISKAIERGRFDDARTLAQRARVRSIHYYQFIEENLFHARRDAGRSAWSEDVLPKLDEARTHLNERRKHEAAIIDSIRGHVAHARGEARDRLLELMNTIEDCQQRHAVLLKRVMTASEEFRQIQASAFRVRRVQHVPDLEDRILVPLLGAPMKVVRELSDEIAVAFAAPTPPKLYDLTLLFEKLTEPAAQRDPAREEEMHDLVPLEHVAPAFDPDEIRTAEEWITREIASRKRLDLVTAIEIAEEQALSESTLRCVLFVMLRSWSPVDDPFGVVASIDGAIAHKRAAGDNLVLTKDPDRWTA